MKFFKNLILVFSIALLLNSCDKEYSFENPFGANAGITIGNNCIIKKIIEYDTLGNRGAAALNYLFNATGDKIVAINEVDSITLNTLFGKNPVYIQDTIRLDANQYFIVDLSTGRIKQFVGNEDPYNNSSPVFIFNFTYDASGKITEKTKSSVLFPAFVVEKTEYAFTNNDLTGIVRKLPLLNTTIFSATMEYDLAKLPKNYLPVLPDCNELAPYIAAMQIGTKSIHPVKKVVLKNFDQLTGTFIDSSVTNYTNYKYSLDNYVLSVDASGFDIPAVPLVKGRNKFEYFCR